MKRLYIAFIATLFILGFGFANDFVINASPMSQNGISGSVLTFDVSAKNNTGFGVFVTQSFPVQIKYKNANILPTNNPALTLGIETTPRWSLPAGQTLNLVIKADVVAQAFPALNVSTNIVNTSLFNLTSAIVEVNPIADLVVQKVMVGVGPQITGDNVVYNIVVKNIGSDVATGIRLVDIRPNNVVTFPNQGLVDGNIQVPTIYNNLENNYIFNINNLSPGASANIQITGTMNSIFFVGQQFTNKAFVLTDTTQYNIANDDISITNTVRGIPNLYVNITKVSNWPALIGDLVTYLISYGNNGTESATGVVLNNILPQQIAFLTSSIVPNTQFNNNTSWSLGSLTAGQSKQILITGKFLGGVDVGSSFVSSAQISTSDMELNMSDNTSIATGSLAYLSAIGATIYAKNLTDPSRNSTTGNSVLAISGDNVQLEIVLVNSGNVGFTGSVYLSNITGFVNYSDYTTWTFSLNPLTSQNIIVNAVVGPKGFISFSPKATIVYSGSTIFDTVLINEQLICGDGLLTQNEVCDTNGPVGNILPGQVCIEQNGQCVLRTDSIINSVYMYYVTDIGTGQQYASVSVSYKKAENTNALCDFMYSPSSTIVVNANNQGSMNFTCSSQNNVVANQIKIDCGNGIIGQANGVSSLTNTCNYTYDSNASIDANTYNARCYVDDHTRDQCASSIMLNKDLYGVCGDGRLDAGEECDLSLGYNVSIIIGEYLDSNRNYLSNNYGNGNYSCKNCRIRGKEGQFAYQPPQCLGVNTTISVMENEIFPFWWRLWNRQEQMVASNYNCDNISSNETITIIKKESMKCTFAIYDGNGNQQINDRPLNVFVSDCFEKDNSIIFNYFEKAYKIDFNKVSGKYVRSMESVFNGKVKTYGEYKLVLEKVEYEYCSPITKKRENGRLYQGICEVNFALTRPYIMQISTFGLDPIATSASDFLKDFYDMKGKKLIENTDINETINVTSNSYAFDSAVQNQITAFKKKYDALSITVDNKFKVTGNKTIGDLFNNGVVKKVPNQMIFFVKGNGQLVLKQLTQMFPSTPFTIYVEGMDVLIEGSVVTNGMIITDKKILFEDDSSKEYCEAGGQIVNGIFVAKGGFDSISKTINVDKTKERCPWGNLRIKGILIGNGVENLIKNRRSHLNDWFLVANDGEAAIKRERKNEIFEGAALLIEYNPSLWTQLPPGADSITKTLDIYKK